MGAKTMRARELVRIFVGAALAVGMFWILADWAEAQERSVATQIAELRAKTAQLETALVTRQQQVPMGPGVSRGGTNSGMVGMRGMGGMGMMDDMMEMMGGGGGMPMGGAQAMPMAGGGGGMPMLDEMMQMGMSRMGGQAGTQASALPGFPGQSHLYHIGATGFFVDHPEHIALSIEQQSRLNQMKQEALIAQADFERRIAEAEQELWLLTASDMPQINKVEAKAREIEKLRADQRIAFIRAVGNAAAVLSDEHRKVLTGTLPPAPAAPPMPMPQSAPPQGQGGGMMDDM